MRWMSSVADETGDIKAEKLGAVGDVIESSLDRRALACRGIQVFLADLQPACIEELAKIADAAHPSFAISRSMNFWILPVDVFGNSLNTM